MKIIFNILFACYRDKKRQAKRIGKEQEKHTMFANPVNRSKKHHGKIA